MGIRVFVSLACGLLMTTGCTIRYSQSLAAAMDRSTGSAVNSSDRGFTLIGITLSEPTSAHDQVRALVSSCSRLTKVQVDYRELSFLAKWQRQVAERMAGFV